MMTTDEMKEWIQLQLQLLTAADRDEKENGRHGNGVDVPFASASSAERAGMRMAFGRMFNEIRQRERAAGVRPSWQAEPDGPVGG